MVKKTHGYSATATYRAWYGMNARCYNPKDNNYLRYNGRGITVCDRWRFSFENFLEDMGEKPDKSLTLDRINNDGNYEPTNCRWATYIVQNNNKSLTPPTHCINGHEYTEANKSVHNVTKERPNGRIYCKKCNANRAQVKRDRLKSLKVEDDVVQESLL